MISSCAVESVTVAVAMAWYEHELLLGVAAQVRKFHYLCMRSSKNDHKKTGLGKTGPARPLAMALGYKCVSGVCVCV